MTNSEVFLKLSCFLGDFVHLGKLRWAFVFSVCLSGGVFDLFVPGQTGCLG